MSALQLWRQAQNRGSQQLVFCDCLHLNSPSQKIQAGIPACYPELTSISCAPHVREVPVKPHGFPDSTNTCVWGCRHKERTCDMAYTPLPVYGGHRSGLHSHKLVRTSTWIAC